MVAATMERNGGMALWRQMQNDLTKRIREGEFAGEFPGETALSHEYGVSRQTTRQALRALRDAGVVSAEQGRPPRVRPGVLTQPLGTLYSLFASVEAAGKKQESVVLRLEILCDQEAAGHLGLEADAELLYLERVRLAADEPLAWDKVWLPAQIAAPLLEADFNHTALYREASERLGLHPNGGKEFIQAITLDDEQAQHLGAAPGSAAFRIYRRGHTEDGPFEWRETVIRSDLFELSAEYSPAARAPWAFTSKAQAR